MGQAVKERPILFSGPMVNAIIEGRKTQTRRLVKPDPVRSLDYHTGAGSISCPYGGPGDRLWVRESFYCDHCFVGDYELTAKHELGGSGSQAACQAVWRKMLYFAADGPLADQDEWSERTPPLTPSIHMPRWASRITLDVIGVRVERLQNISEEDARAEGVPPLQYLVKGIKVAGDPAYRDGFRKLWDGLNGETAPWSSNPWVWVISFRMVEQGGTA